MISQRHHQRRRRLVVAGWFEKYTTLHVALPDSW